jgi:hypothetical protein
MTRRFLTLLCTCIAILALAGCPTAGTGDDDDAGCSSSTTEWTCENGACSCDDDMASCTDPDETTADDADNCDNACYECLD